MGPKKIIQTASTSTSTSTTALIGPGTDGANQIILTTQQMAFFLFNLFGHDIIHDAHPALNSGSDRIFTVLTNTARDSLDTISSPELSKGGGNEDDDFLGLTKIIENTNLKKKAEKSVEDIVTSIGNTLMERKMLYAIKYKKKQQNDTITFKDFQEKTFIIIDTERILKNYNNNDDPTYPGDIFYKGKRIEFWKINVNYITKNISQYIVVWKDDESNTTYTVNIPSQKQNNRVPTLTTQENSGTSDSFFILCTENDTNNFQNTCGSFPLYIKALGNEFFYDTFVTFMENETYNSIDGIISMFPNYILEYTDRKSSSKNYHKYEHFFNEFLVYFQQEEDTFIGYKYFYKNFLSVIEEFRKNLKNLKISYANDNFELPKEIDENIPPDNKTINKNFNKYITILAKIFAGYFNNYEGAEIIYNKYILPKLKESSCNINDRYVQNFLRMSSLYFKSSILDLEDITNEIKNIRDEQSGGKRYKQSGGVEIKDIMSTSQKDSLEAKNNNLKPKFDTIMTGVFPYDGLLEPDIINEYKATIEKDSNSIFANILDLILPNLSKNITKNNDDILLGVKNSSNGWIHLFNINDFPGTNKYLKGIDAFISPTSSSLNNIVKMPATGNTDIKPIFKMNCKDVSEIDKNNTLKTLPVESKNVIVELYNFEQAFIVQLKVFLLYNYINLNFEKKSSLPTYPSYPSSDKMTSFFINFKENFSKYYSIFQIVISAKIDSFSQVQKVNTGYMISSSIGVISYCIKQISASDINRIADSALDNEMEILESIYLTKNLQKGSSVGDPDDKLIKHFKKIISSGLLSFNGESNYTISNSNSINNNEAKIMKSIKLPTTIKTNDLYLINNAINSTGMPDFFCPYSSILDGQATCSSYDSALAKGNPIENGTLNVIVRNGLSGSAVETMRYHVRVKKSAQTNEWNNDKKILEISAYLKIKDIVLINIGFGDVIEYNHKDKSDNTKKDTEKGPDDVIKVDLTGNEKSPFDAKVCIKNIIENNIGLITNSDNSIKPWSEFLKIINETDSSLVSTKKYDSISRNLFRRKIIQTSFIKSLGDYLQEINTVAYDGGYINNVLPDNATNGNTVLSPNTFRLGLSNDRPSGVRIASLLLFGLSGINPNAMGGYYTIAPAKTGYNGSFMIASRNKTLLNNPGKTIAGGSKILTKNKKNKNNTKRYKNKTKKRKILLKKNRKLSKRNNKGNKKKNK